MRAGRTSQAHAVHCRSVERVDNVSRPCERRRHRSCPLRALILASLLAAGCGRPPTSLEIVPPPSAAAALEDARLARYQAAVSEIGTAFEQAVGLPRVDVPLVLFPDRRAFEQGLLRIGYPPALARSASAFTAIGGARAVLLNGGILRTLNRTQRTRLLAHELVHSLQYHFSGGTRGASEQWLREGFAEWVACRVTAHLGLASFESLRDEVLAGLADDRLGAAPAPLHRLATFPQWVEAQDRYESPLYVQAFVAAELLVETHGVARVVQYFERFRNTSDAGQAFVQAFGTERAEFERAFLRRWHSAVARWRSP